MVFLIDNDLDFVILIMDVCFGGVNELFMNIGLFIIGMILMNFSFIVSLYINNNIIFVRFYNLLLNICILKIVLDNYVSVKVVLLFFNNFIEYLFL